MTPEELESLILNSKNTKKLQAAFAPLTEQERKALSTTANKIKTQIYRGVANKDASRALRNFLAQKKESYRNPPPFYNAGIALFALCPLSVIKRSDIFLAGERDVLEQVILDRKPEWLDEWIEDDVEKEFSMVTFSMIRKWYGEGICIKPAADGYIRKFAWEMMWVGHDKNDPPKPPLSERLIAEPDMLDDVWRLFEIESQAFNTEGWITKNAPDNYETWPDALVRLSEKGLLDRQRLLDASLQGLLLDLKQNQLSGFHKFHERLSPTKEELEARQADYLALMSHPVGHVIKFALKMTGLMEKEKILDKKAFLSEVTALFMHEGKGNAIRALKMIDRMIKKEGHLVSLGLSSVTEGLKHADSDVQGTAMEILKKYQSAMTDDHKEDLSNSLDFVAAAVKHEVSVLIGNKTLTETESTCDAEGSEEDLKNKLASLSEGEKTALGFGNLKTFDSGAGFLPPISSHIMDHNILPTLEPLKPIGDLDELISAVSHAVEITETADLVEQIIDGISRFCDRHPDDFNSKVAPLLNRLESGGGFGAQEGLVDSYGGFRLAMADLILTWLTKDLYHSPDNKYFSQVDMLVPSITRIRDITSRVVKREAKQLMATPTHWGGWIDPMIWIERIIRAERDNITYDRMDFCLSFLRLTPDNRNEARRYLSKLPEKVRRVVDFALGGQVVTSYDDRSDYDIWISAARGRDPYANWAQFFQPFKLNDSWPDSVYPAIYKWNPYTKDEGTYKFSYMDIDITCEASPEKKDDSGKEGGVRATLDKIGNIFGVQKRTNWESIPSAGLSRRSILQYSWSTDINTSWVVNWLKCQWPLNPESVYMQGADQMMRRIDMDGSTLEPSHGFFYGLFEKKRPWREPAHLMICMGLVGKDADSRGLAIDAVVEGIEDGRADISLLSDILVKLADGGWLKLNRLADNLLHIARTSAIHAWAVSHLIQGWLLHVSLTQHNLFKMLETLLEVQFIIKQPLDNKTGEILSSLTGSSKAAKLAKQLQNLKKKDHTLIGNISRNAVNKRITKYKQACAKQHNQVTSM